MTDLKVNRGRAKTWEFAVTEDGAVPPGLDTAEVRFTVRRRFPDELEAPLVVKSISDGGVAWTNASAGEGTFSLDGSELDGVPDWDTALVWDLVLIDANASESAIDDGFLFVRTTAS